MGMAAVIPVNGSGLDVDGVKTLTGGELPTLVIDATGSNQSMSSALEYCGFTGRLVFVGLTQAEVSFPHAPVMHRRELTLLASRKALPADFTRIIKLIGDGRIDTRQWISHEVGFDELIQHFLTGPNPKPESLKRWCACIDERVISYFPPAVELTS